MSVRTCKICNKTKDISNFYKRKTPNGIFYFRAECIECRNIYNSNYYENNKVSIIKKNNEYRSKNKDKRNKQISYRKKRDISFKINLNIRSIIKITIKRAGGNKNGNSCLKYLDFSINELKNHLEKQFEPWMTWQNWGVYNSKTWDDNNQATWTWQLDHIIPQSDLSYNSLNHENFKKCWALSNLRPYSAKLNILDGVNRVRHISTI